MKKIVLGIMAHVDAGKTTLAEAMLYVSGSIRKQGSVDDGNTVMDSHAIEKERGITIFASSAQLEHGGTLFTLLDTPGHVDFSPETERILSATDYAVLIISGTDGVQSHTRTLFDLAAHYSVPLFVFVTKMDYARMDIGDIVRELNSSLGEGFADMLSPGRDEEISMLDEDTLETYLETGLVPDEHIRRLITQRKLFPVFSGSGTKLTGVGEFLDALDRYTVERDFNDTFGARVFKISRDSQGVRLTHIRVTGGSLRVKDSIGNEKINQIRIYSGARYTLCDEAFAGDLVAVTGPVLTYAGQGLGTERDLDPPVTGGVMNYRIALPGGEDPAVVYQKLSVLSEEDPSLNMTFDASTRQIRVDLMGEVQTEIIRRLILDRFGIDCTMDMGKVLYRETISGKVEGVGHYEPLRHYAEVHLILEGLPRGSGLVFENDCSLEVLDRNWQSQIMSCLRAKTHRGVLTGSPVTDMKITLVSGRSHPKHTEGGDFRQASFRAVRQGLMKAESILLEPWYELRLTVPSENTGRAVNDLRQLGAVFSSPEDDGSFSVITGRAPATLIGDYARTVASYTSGRGRLSLRVWGYDTCHDADKVIQDEGYDPITDLGEPTGSVFCAHGGGFDVSWDKVEEYMHLESSLRTPKPAVPEVKRRNLDISEKELQEIMEREFGKDVHPYYRVRHTLNEEPAKGRSEEYVPVKRRYIIDGYNVIFSWEELRELAERDIAAAREKLIHIMSNFSAFTSTETVLVFDGYRVKGSSGEKSDYQGIHLVYTMENETADAYIQKLLRDIGKNEQVYVITGDGLVQLSAMHSGALRRSSRDLLMEVEEAGERLSEILERQPKESFQVDDQIKDKHKHEKDS